MKKLKDFDRKIIDAMMGRVADEIGEERLKEITTAVYKEIYGEEPTEPSERKEGSCGYAPYCGVPCHVFGFSCDYKPCVT